MKNVFTDVLDIPADTLQTAVDWAQLAQDVRGMSLSQFNKPTRLACIAMVEENITLLPPDRQNALMQTALSLYTAEYLNAVTTAAATVNNVRVLSILNQFSSDRDPIAAGIPAIGEAAGLNSLTEGISLDDFVDLRPGMERDVSMVELDKYSNLAVGKNISFELGSGDKSLKLTASARIYPQIVRQKDLLPVLSYLNKDNTMKGRFHRWRAGELATLDYLTALDIVRDKRKASINDRTDILKNQEMRKNRGMLATVLSGGKGSKNNASGVVVITKSFATQLEGALRGRLSSRNVRDKFFEHTSSMILMVVNPELEVFDLYFHSIAEKATYSFDDIKGAAKNGNAIDINDVMRAYSKSNMPSL